MSESLSRRINIYVNSGDAEKAYEKLEKSNQRLTASEQKLIEKTKQLGQTLAGIDKNADPKAFRKATKDLEDMNKAVDANRIAQKKNADEMDRINKKISGEISPSYNDLSKSVRRLTQELKSMDQSNPDFSSKLTELKQAKAEMNKFETAINGGKKAYSSMFQDIKSIALGSIVAGGLTGIAAAAGGMLTGSTDAAIEREKKRRELQAITGVAEEELTVLDQYASELSRIQLESGKAFNTSTNDIYEAFKLVGSAKPELLSNIDALKATTKEVLVLSKASGLDLAQSTRAVTSILNQFNMGAGESKRVINALAAGAKEGAKEIPWLTDAFEKVGPIAANSNMSIEETIAALEVLGLSMSESSVAGNGLKNVILELQKEGYGKMADGTFNYAKAMKEVENELNNNVDVIKVFGKESAVAALIAQKNTGEYERLTKALSGTSSAYDQASIQTIELEERQKEFSKALNNTAAIIGQRLTPVMLWLYDAGMKVMGVIRNAPQLWDQYKLVVLAVVAVIAQYNLQLILMSAAKARAAIATTALTIAETAGNVVSGIRNGILGVANLLYAVYTGNVSRATAVQILFNGAMSTLILPLTALVGLFYAVKKGLDMYNSSSDASIQLLKQKKQFSTDFTKIMKDNEIAYAGVNKQIENFNKLSALEQQALEKKIATERILMMDKVNTLKLQRGAMEKNAEKEEGNSFSGTFGQVLLPGYYTDEKLKKNKEEARLAVRNSFDAQIKEAEQGLKQWSDSMSRIEAQKDSKNISVAGGGGAGATGSDNTADERRKKRDEELKMQADFEKRMKELREEYYMANITDDQREIERINVKYQALKQELDKVYPEMNASKEAYIQELNRLQELEKSATQNSIDYRAALAANDAFNEASKQKLKERYAQGEIDHEQYTHDIEVLDLQLLSARVNIAHNYQDKAKQACSDLTKFEKDEQDKRIADQIKANEERLKAQEALDKRIKEFELSKASKLASKTATLSDDKKAEIDSISYKYDMEIKAAKDNAALIEQIEIEKAFALSQINQEYRDKEIELDRQKAQKTSDIIYESLQGMSSVVNGFTQIMGMKADADLRKEQNINDRKKKHYKSLLDSKRISQEQHDQLTQEADETMARKQAEIKRKQFEAEKMAKTIEIVISTAVAIAKAIAINPMGGGLPGSAIAAANGAIQLALVQAQPTPEFATGANFKNNVLLDGASHEQGGMAVMNERGQKVAEFEGNELLLGKKFKENNSEWIGTLLDMGRNGGRLSDLLLPPGLPKLTIADVMPSASVKLPQVDARRVAENVKYKQGADFGGSGSTAVAEIDKMPKEQAKEIQATVFVEILKKLTSIDEKLDAVNGDIKVDYERLGLELAKGLKRVKY
jgi:TP901 family phage tail tape measure protein